MTTYDRCLVKRKRKKHQALIGKKAIKLIFE